MLEGDHVSAGREPHVAVKGGDSDGISDNSFEFVHRRLKFEFFVFSHARVPPLT